MSNILKSTSFYTLANILPQAVAFILLPLYTQYLLPEEYGIVNAMTVVQGILAIFFSLSIERAIIRMYWDYPDKEKLFLGTLSISITILSFIVLICSFVLRDFLQLLFTDIEFYPFYTYTIVLTFSLTFSLVPKNYYRLKNKAKEYFLISLSELILNTLLTILFLVYLKEGALGVIKAKMYASLILLPLFIGIIIKYIDFRFDFSILKNCLSFSLPIIPTVFAAWILGQADRIFIADYLSLHDVGIYSLSRRIAGMIGIIAGAFTMAYHPLFFEISKLSQDKEKELKKMNDMFILGLMLIAFLISLISKEVIVLFLDPKYFGANDYISVIIFSYFVGSVSSTILGAYLQQSKKMMVDMFFAIAGAVITIVLYYLLIPILALWGAVIASLLTTIAIFFSLYYYSKRKTEFYPFDWSRIIGNLSAMTIIIISSQILFKEVSLITLGIKLVIWVAFFLNIIKSNPYFRRIVSTVRNGGG